MSWFSNMKIGKKLAFGFGIVLALLVVIAGFAVYTANKIDADYSYMDEYPMRRSTRWGEVESSFHAIRRSVSHAGFFVGLDNHDSNVTAMRQTYDQDIAAMDADLAEIRQLILDDTRKTDTERAELLKNVDDIIAAAANWHNVMTRPVMDAFAVGDRDTAVNTMAANASIGAAMLEGILANYNESSTVAAALSAATTVSSRQAIMIMVALSAAALIVGIILAVAIARAITKPITRLVDVVGNVAEGRLNVNIDRNNITRDEVGTLTMGVVTLVDAILLIVAELDHMSNDFEAGDIEAKVDASKFKGSYREVVEGVNAMVGELVSEVLEFMGVLAEFGGGNFAADLPALPGKKALMNENINAMRANLRGVSGEINYLVAAARDGELDKRVDADKYSGDWATLLGSMNELMKAIADPISEADKILTNIAAGNFEHQMHGNYKGAFLTIKNAVNETVTNISSYIEEISSVLDALANNNLNQDITREYVGDFSSIKSSLLNIIKNFNEVISQIYAASDQVASGARSISEGSMSMAQGATEQASSIEELNATVQVIAGSTQENAKSAGEADSLSKQSKDMAALGDEDMANMLKSMDGIKASSDGISRIIKVIDDIAFQTNILSLNAAVEAARAGEHGKGFAVVAEEVRNLAARSQSNARETAQLIEESITRVNEGMGIANKTADALRQIVESVTKVSGIIEGITQASQEQSSAISQVMEGIHQITGVIQSNSSTTEEAASAAEELSSQSEVLRGLVDVFTLKAAR